MKLKYVRIEQKCFKCDTWCTLDQAAQERLELEMRLTKGRSFALFPTIWLICSRCGTDNAAVRIGKYDKAGTPKDKCSIQYVELRPSKYTIDQEKTCRIWKQGSMWIFSYFDDSFKFSNKARCFMEAEANKCTHYYNGGEPDAPLVKIGE